jgi:hypothetical protein
MKKIASFLFLTLLLMGCPKRKTFAQNIQIPNADFEEGNKSWSLCGGATIISKSQVVDNRMVKFGNYALRINSTGECGTDISSYQASAEIDFNIPSNINSITISFDYSRIANPIRYLNVGMLTEVTGGSLVQKITDIKVSNLDGFHTFKKVLSGADFEKFRGRRVKLYFVTSYLFGFDTIGSNSPLNKRNQEPDAGFYIDNLKVENGEIRNKSEQLPAYFSQINSSPLAYLDYESQAIVKANPNGTQKVKLKAFEAGWSPTQPTWNHDGSKIYFFRESLQGTSTLEVNPAIIYIMYSVDKNGNNFKEEMRTTGILGFEPTNPTPSNPKKPALDVRISEIRFSPNGKLFSITRNFRERYKNGSTNDSRTMIEIYEVSPMKKIKEIDLAYSGEWIDNNSIVYINNNNVYPKATGIWVNQNINATNTEKLIVPGTGGQFEFSLYQDISVSASADGRYISSIRYVEGQSSDNSGFGFGHTALMIFDKNDNYRPVQRLLLDHGTTSNGLHTWTKDGKYILYHLQESKSVFNIWWVEVATGKTGRITTNGASISPTWSIASIITATENSVEPTENYFTIYPNPVLDGKVNLVNHQNLKIKKIELIDSQGKVIEQSYPAESNLQFKAQNAAFNQITFLKIYTDERIITKKVLLSGSR